MENEQIKISVRNLIEFVLRSGDLDSRFTVSNRALEGTKAHQKIQREYIDKFSKETQIVIDEVIEDKRPKKEYNAEVTIKHNIEHKGFHFIVEGRIDGIIIENEEVTIDEIKTVAKPLDLIDENYNELHWAQAKCYAYIYGIKNNLQKINVQITYYNINSNETKYLMKSFNINELNVFFLDLLDKYCFWAKFIKVWNRKRNISIKNMSFPFTGYRKGQRELAVAVYGTIKNEKNMFVQAPTGIGKTISTLFPAVKAMGEGFTSKIFYLTAKTITRSVVEEAVANMKSQGLNLKTVTLTAKEKICFKEKTACNPEDCEFAKGHFDRVNNALSEILFNESTFNRETIEKYAKLFKVCPFELSLDLALLSDCIICDYNYVFDPRVYLRRFFDTDKEDYVFLIDEAHNLVDRSREMFSSELFKQPFLELKKIMKNIEPKIAKALEKINSCILKVRSIGEEYKLENINENHLNESDNSKKVVNMDLLFMGENFYVQKSKFEQLNVLLRRFISESEEWLANNSKNNSYEQFLELYFNCLTYTRIAELYDDRFVTFVEKKGNDVKIKLFCLDPSYLLKECLKRAKTSIFFSATLTPINYFKEMLGGTKEDYILRLPSPFSIENRKILIADKVSTRYKWRENSYSIIIRYISSIIRGKKGNYIIFFPSYKYMQDLYEQYVKIFPEVTTIMQQAHMTEEEREDFLENFKENSEEDLVGFAVLGGIFSEGIDLKRNRLIGCIIIGVGLPQICIERDIIMKYFNKKCNKGYEYAYMYPGMNKVLQAAGRVIRTEKDKGIILLIDDRFSTNSYKNLFPREWYPNTIIKNTKDIENNLINFWRK